MSDPSLDNFDGVARLFPLPNLVMFPSVVQPLHIFEPRYRQMTADALAGDRLIAMALLKPGWEEDYERKPALFPMVCLGKIAAEQRLADGKYNLLLRGLSRATIVQEIDQDKLYRTARVELRSDGAAPDGETAGPLLRRLGQAVLPWFPAQGQARDQLGKLLENQELPLGVLADLIAFATPLPAEDKQTLLDELDVEARVLKLLQLLQSGEPPKAKPKPGKYPPDFSPN